MSLKTFFFPLSVIVAVFLIIWVIVPQWEAVQEEKEKLSAKEDVATNLENKKQKIDQGISLYKEKMRDTAVIYNALPSEIDNDIFIDELFNGAKNKGVLITSVSLDDATVSSKESVNKSRNTLIAGEEDDSQKFQTLPEAFEFGFDLELVGGYIEARNFVSFLESANRLFVVDDLLIKKEDAEGSDGIINVSISGKAFYKKENPNISVKTAIYSDDPVLDSLVGEKGKLNVEYINTYKNRIANKGYSFSPDITGIGKDNLFSGGVVTPVTSEDSAVQ